MASLSNKFITARLPWSANMTELNHLGLALQAKPDVLEGKTRMLFSSKDYYSDNPLTSFLSRVGGGTMTVKNPEWEWKLMGAECRPLIAMENVEDPLNTTLGKGRVNFKIKLDENWYLPGDVLSPGNPSYQVRVQEQAIRHGQGWVYVVRLMSDTFGDFLPPAYVTTGTKWTKLFSQYGEADNQDGSTQYSNGMMLKNRMSRYRKQYSVTNDAVNQVLAIGMTDKSGRMHKSWVSYAESMYWQQWYRELERGIWYSKSTDTVLNDGGRPIYSGAGVQEQILNGGHIHHYSTLTANLIEEFLMDIFYSRVKPGGARKVKGFTGEYGMLAFHRAVQNSLSAKGFLQVVDTNFVKGTSSEYSSNALQFGYQFTKYVMANGIELELIHNPLYDDRSLHTDIDPITGKPKESQRITFLDFEQGGESNIQLVKKENSFALVYVNGLWSPTGPNKGSAAHSGAYYSMHCEDQLGTHIHDITKCGELILSSN